MLLYYLGRLMDKLADENLLPEYIDGHLSVARVRDRSYEHVRNGFELTFKLLRHVNAWRDETRMKLVVQTWIFDFKDLSLKQIDQRHY